MFKNIPVFLTIIIIITACTNPTSGEKVKLTDYSNQYKILYNYDYNIYSIFSDGSRLEQITTSGLAWVFDINEDFSKIAYVMMSDKQVYIIDSDGSNTMQLTQSISHYEKALPKFLPGEDAVIYVLQPSLYRVNIDGSNDKKITPDSLNIVSYNSYSVSAGRIVFVGYKSGSNVAKIYLMHSDGTALTALTELKGVYENPRFSADGTKILYSQIIDSTFDVFYMKSDGRNKINISDSPHQDVNAVWSPDGSKIAFERIVRSSTSLYERTEIYIAITDGKALSKIYSRKLNPGLYNFNISWSPDMTRLAFLAPDKNDEMTIFLLDIASGSVMKLTEGLYNTIWLNN